MVIEMRNRKNIFYYLLISIVLLTSACEGNQDLYLINCSNDIAILKLTPGRPFRQQSVNDYQKKNTDPQFIPTDSIVSKYQLESYQEEFNNQESCFQINGDLLTVKLKPGESLRLALSMWIFTPHKTNEASLNIDNLTIITKSDTCVARTRKEILQLQKNKKFKYDKKYKDKVGPKTREHPRILIK